MMHTTVDKADGVKDENTKPKNKKNKKKKKAPAKSSESSDTKKSTSTTTTTTSAPTSSTTSTSTASSSTPTTQPSGGEKETKEKEKERLLNERLIRERLAAFEKQKDDEKKKVVPKPQQIPKEFKPVKVEDEKLDLDGEIKYSSYAGEEQMHLIQKLIEKDLSEPYSIFTYRYFLNHWPELCWLAFAEGECVGTIICKLAPDRRGRNKGYIAMLAVDSGFRGKGIGSTLVKLSVRAMEEKKCDVVVLETEITNKAALALYEKLDFVREKRLQKYYLNGVDAFRLKLWLTPFYYFRQPEENM